MVKLLHDIFAYADVNIVVHTLDQNGVEAMSTNGNAEFYADVDKERYSGKFYLENRELQAELTKDFQSCQQTCDKIIPVYRNKTTLLDSLSTTYLTNPKNIQTTLKNPFSSTRTSQIWFSWLTC